MRIGASGAKFDTEADFEVCLPPALPKPRENIEKHREIFGEKKINSFSKKIDDFFAESIRMYPNVSEFVETGTNRT